MKKTLKQVSGLFLRSTRYLFFLEIIYKGIGAIAIFPLCETLLHVALRLSGIHYISGQNLKAAFTNPFIITALFIIFVILTLFQGFEMMCLALSYQQTYYKERIGWGQLAIEGLKRALRLFRPRNILLLPILVLLLPSLLYFIQNSSNNYVTLITTLIRSAFSSIPTGALVAIGLLIVLVISMIGMFAIQFHISSDRNSYRSIRGSLGILRRNLKSILGGLLVWLIIVCVVLALINFGVYGIITLIVRMTVKASARRAVTLTWFSYARLVLNFMNFSVLSFAGYAYVSAYYYQKADPERVKKDKVLVHSVNPKSRTHRRIAGWSFVMAVALTFVVNILMLYSVKKDTLGGFLSSAGMAIISHRGVITEYSENTLGALQEGIDAHADFIEFDVQLTKDGEVALLHDKTLKRCWGISGVLSDYTAAELSGIVDEDGQHLPTLREVFDMCKDQNVGMLIELKVNAYNNAQDLATATMKVIEEYELSDRCMIQSFSYNALKTIKSIDPNMICGYLMNASIGTPSDLEYADFFSVNLNYITRSTAVNVHLRNKKLVAWTVNIPSRMDRAVEYGTDGIITDRPIEARERIYGDSFLENIIPETEENEEDAEVTQE